MTQSNQSISRLDATPTVLRWVVLIGVLFWLLRLVVLWWVHADTGVGGDVSLHVDEAQYWDWSRHLQWGYYSKPPMIAALIAASTALFGDAELGVKALPIVCYSLTAVVLYFFAGSVVSATYNRRAGVWTAALFLASPLVGVLSLAATTDAPLLLFWALALWLGWRSFVTGSWRLALLLGLVCGLGLLSKYTMAACIAGIGCAWLLVGVLRGRIGIGIGIGIGKLAAMFALVCVVVAAVLSPNILWNADNGWPTMQHTAEITAGRVAQRGVGESAGSLLGFVLGQVVLVGPLVVLLLVLLRGFTKSKNSANTQTAKPETSDGLLRPYAGWYLLCTALPLACAGLLQAWHGKAQINWIAPVLLPVFVLLGAVVARWADGWRRTAKVLAAVQFVLITVLAVLPMLWAMAAPNTLPPKALDLWARMRGWESGFEQLKQAVDDDTGVHSGARSGVRVLAANSRSMQAQAAYHTRHWGANGSSPLPPKAWLSDTSDGVHSHYELRYPWPAGTVPPDVRHSDAVWWVMEGSAENEHNGNNNSAPAVDELGNAFSVHWQPPVLLGESHQPAGRERTRSLYVYRSLPRNINQTRSNAANNATSTIQEPDVE